MGSLLGDSAVDGLVVPDFLELGSVELSAVGSLGVDDLDHLEGLVLLEGTVAVLVVGGEEGLEHLLESLNADWVCQAIPFPTWTQPIS